MLTGFDATVRSSNDSATVNLQVTSSAPDTAQFIWTTLSFFSANPVKRVLQYFKANTITNNVGDLATQLKNYFGDERNIYGMEVLQQRVTDSSLIALRHTFSHYPTVVEVYGMIDSIRNYIKQNGGQEANLPMLNVHKDGPAIYEVMVAVPTKKDVRASNKFLLKKMVKGGIYTIAQGEEQLTNYVSDYKKVSPAIPYQSLVTDRRMEPDTTKWITRLYYPIF